MAATQTSLITILTETVLQSGANYFWKNREISILV